ncbi:hypothetical protein [Robiginitalea sp. SC105]|uniref:hypothetical protein n=1 Tax=Robiginitalea sp. SC105 TaxID=2762332 RepID=UPI00163B5842|nr:hypothetical protein [Robiginitalea sp. SC105]MBC2840269.1 hypothetical protein [Robiginitalea sp. SC105]
MKHTQKLGTERYENLGKLFFAVAMADGRVDPAEVTKLRKIVRERWLPVDDIEDPYHSDAAYQIETVFDWALEHDMTSAQGFDDFADFYHEHPGLFPDQIKLLILDTASAVANAFALHNKSELILLGKLQLLFAD